MTPVPSAPAPSPPTGPAQGPGQRLLTLSEAARYLQLSPWTVRELIWRGVLPRVRISRKILLDRQDLDTLIDTHKEGLDRTGSPGIGLPPPMSLPRKARKGGQR